jgi:hypothetical protein
MSTKTGERVRATFARRLNGASAGAEDFVRLGTESVVTFAAKPLVSFVTIVARSIVNCMIFVANPIAALAPFVTRHSVRFVA